MSEKLVSVEIQKEFDVLNKNWQEQVFIKLYVAVRTSGFLANISDRDWKTLCVLATFMDSQGNCYPSQDEIATSLGVCRQAANERISSLLKYRWQEKPIVVVVKHRKDVVSGKKGQRWDNNRYTILPLSNISFGKDHEHTHEINEKPMLDHDIGFVKKPMSSDHVIGKCLEFTEKKPMSPYPDTGKDDTNKIFKRSVVVEQPGDEKISNSEESSSSVKNDGAAFALPAAPADTQGSVCQGAEMQTDREEKRPEEKTLGEPLTWEQIRVKVREVAGADISIGFAKDIAEKYSPDDLEMALTIMKCELLEGMTFKKGVGAWLRAALQRKYEKDKKPATYPELKKGNNRPPRARPKRSYVMTPEQCEKKKALIRSLYV